MPFFADTNIPTGYTVIHDKWHPEAKKFFSEVDDEIFWSNYVKYEYTKKLKNIVKLIDHFLKKSNYTLKNNHDDFVNYQEFEKYVLDHTKTCELDDFKKIGILEEFWNKYNFSEGISAFVSLKFKEFSEDFEKIYFKRDLKLNNIMILHDCGLDNYLKYYEYAKQLYGWGVHEPDCKIIVDAHDCGLTHDDLVFVTNDVKMLEAVSRMDTSHLKIMEFRSCN